MARMGNWRTVNITGTIAADEVGPLRERLSYSYDRPDGFDNFGSLSFNRERPSLCGIGDWPATSVSAIGNLAERGYSPEDVRAELERLLEIAPSMMLTVHCGGDYETDECVATIRTGEGLAVLLPPEVEKIAEIPGAQAFGNLMANLIRPL
jgi:hypothetical protein